MEAQDWGGSLPVWPGTVFSFCPVERNFRQDEATSVPSTMVTPTLLLMTECSPHASAVLDKLSILTGEFPS